MKKTRSTYHHGDLKTSLKEAALRLVLEKGPRGFSLNEASRLAGVTAAAPYRHFEDKDALLAVLAEEGFLTLANTVRKAAQAGRNHSDQMLRAGLAYLDFARKHRGYFVVMFSAGLDQDKYPALKQAGQNAFGTILSLVAARGDEPATTSRLAVGAWALVHGLATLDGDGMLGVDPSEGCAAETNAVLLSFTQGMFPERPK